MIRALALAALFTLLTAQVGQIGTWPPRKPFVTSGFSGRQAVIPGVGFIDETAVAQRVMPGVGFDDEGGQ